jgi:hypothetical protein
MKFLALPMTGNRSLEANYLIFIKIVLRCLAKQFSVASIRDLSVQNLCWLGAGKAAFSRLHSHRDLALKYRLPTIP